jgi:hypothetical protein
VSIEQVLNNDQGNSGIQVSLGRFDAALFTEETGEDRSSLVDVFEQGEIVGKVIDMETTVKKLFEIEAQLSDLTITGITRVGAEAIKVSRVDPAGKEAVFEGVGVAGLSAAATLWGQGFGGHINSLGAYYL